MRRTCPRLCVSSILTREPELFKNFEVAQLGNILPDTAEMAKSLIPSYVRLLLTPAGMISRRR